MQSLQPFEEVAREGLDAMPLGGGGEKEWILCITISLASRGIGIGRRQIANIQ